MSIPFRAGEVVRVIQAEIVKRAFLAVVK
jgi:hypothetical protein